MTGNDAQSASVAQPAPALTLSIVMPVYNEARYIEQIVERVRDVGLLNELDYELIIVDDGSKDGTREKLAALEKLPRVRVIYHEKNQGKGAALHTGFAAARNDFVLVQDADLEYDPQDIPLLLEPALAGRADVVYGSRFISGQSRRVLYYWHSIVNRMLTTMSNMLTNLNISDMEVCYKVMRRELLQKLKLREKRFGFEPEVTIKLARLKPKPRFYEVGISYSGRTYEEGKKIGWKDGVRAVWCMLRYALFD